MEGNELREKVDQANQQLALAERELKEVLDRLQSGTGGDNVMVTEAVSAAFTRVATARIHVIELVKLIPG